MKIIPNKIKKTEQILIRSLLIGHTTNTDTKYIMQGTTNRNVTAPIKQAAKFFIFFTFVKDRKKIFYPLFYCSDVFCFSQTFRAAAEQRYCLICSISEEVSVSVRPAEAPSLVKTRGRLAQTPEKPNSPANGRVNGKTTSCPHFISLTIYAVQPAIP